MTDFESVLKMAKRLADLMWENTLEFNEWQRSGITEPIVKKLSPKYEAKWVPSVEVEKLKTTLQEFLNYITHEAIVAEREQFVDKAVTLSNICDEFRKILGCVETEKP